MFGEEGIVDLYENINEGLDRPAIEDGQIGLNSPVTIVGDVIVVGAALRATAPAPEFPAGFVRGFDARSGEQLWIFHTIPQPGEFGNDTWEDDSWRYSGNTGVWAPMSADEELGYVYLPVETPTNDLYGGHRPRDNLFAESLVCLDAKTGERIWHFQFVHHGIWDYDTPTAPALVDITVAGRRIKAVAQVTKQAFTYVFDRVTGEPVWPIEERPVPQSTVPGELASPTQPFPTRPAPFDRQGVTGDDLLDFTAELNAEARRIASEYRLGPLFTPPILAGSGGSRALLMLPHMTGGANWQGGAVDVETGILYVASVTNPTVAGLTNDPARTTMDYVSGGGRRTPGERQTQGCGDIGPLGLPLIKPPWGRITAIDLNTGDHLWMVPNGDTPDCVKNHPALSGVEIPRTGKPERSGILVTRDIAVCRRRRGRFRHTRVGRGADVLRLRQADWRDPLGVRAAEESERHPHDLHGRRQAIHRHGDRRSRTSGRARGAYASQLVLPLELRVAIRAIMEPMPEEIRASLPVRLSRVREFAEEVEAFGQAAGLPDAKVYIVNLTLDELIANVVMYGFDGVADPKINVELTVADKKLVLVLEDNGRPFDPTQDLAPDTTSPLMERPIGGLGRYFVKRLADRLSYDFVDGRNRVTAEYDLEPAGK